MSLTISPMDEADFPAMTQLLHKAYYSTTGISALLYTAPPSPASLDKTTQTRLRAHRDDPATQHFVKATDAATGALVACAWWAVHRHARSADAVARSATISADELIPEFNVPVHQALFGPLRQVHADVMGGRPHAHLVTLVTDPEQERRGAGALLVRWGVERADEAGLDAYLSASPMGRGLYGKFGFEVVREVPFDCAEFGGEGAVSHVVSVLLSVSCGRVDWMLTIVAAVHVSEARAAA